MMYDHRICDPICCQKSYLWGITIRAPHGGVFVVFAMNKVLPFFITLLIAGAISAALVVLVTKPQEEA